MRYVYADTSIWNRLCDQNTEPDALSLALAERDAGFALGFNVLYEIGKQFFTGPMKATQRGRELFTYIKRYLALRVPIIKENSSLLIEEALDVTGHQRMESCFRNDSQCQIAINEIDKLCREEREPEAQLFFEGRKSDAQASRTNIKDHLESRPDLKTILDGVSDNALPDFLRTASMGAAGQFLLLGHLCREFAGNSPSDLASVAMLLLQSPRYRVSRAMTRSDLYLNWRCVKRGSIRGDLPDDTFHVVNAGYCEVFLTTEADQANVARYSIEGIHAESPTIGNRFHINSSAN